MGAEAQLKPDYDGSEDRQLAGEIARAMHHRPLLSRLASVEPKHPDAALFAAKSAEKAAPEAFTADDVEAPPPVPADPRSLDEVIDDLGQVTMTPPSAEWLENARRAHRQEKMSHAIAWATTLTIAVGIIGFAALLLRV